MTIVLLSLKTTFKSLITESTPRLMLGNPLLQDGDKLMLMLPSKGIMLLLLW